MKYLLPLLFLFGVAKAQHTSPLVNAGAVVNIALPVQNSNISASVTYYNSATMVSQRWTKVQTPTQPLYSIVIVGSSTAAGFGVTTAEYFGTKLSAYYKPLGLVDSVYNAGENGGQTIFAASITGRLNIGGAHQRKIIVLSYPSNGYNGSTYTDAQILNRFREWRDSINNRGYQLIVMGTQPREDFSTGDRTRLNRLNDSLINIFGQRFANVMKIGKNTGNDLWKTTMTIGDQVHGNATFHTAVADLIKSINPFRYIAENFDKIITATATSTNIDSISYKGKHLYQFGVVDSEGHGGSDIVAINANSSCGGTRYYAANLGYYFNAVNLQPGDTLDLLNYRYKYIYIANRNGSATCPIVVMNSGGVAEVYGPGITGNPQVFEGDGSQVKLENCTYIKFTGTGTKDRHGVNVHPYGYDTVRNGSFAFVITGRSKVVEVGDINISNAGIGMEIKQDPTCDTLTHLGQWVMDSITVHHVKIRQVWNQGIYAGNTSPDNPDYDPRPVVCNSVTTYPRPFRLGNVKIFYCDIDSTGRAGIQLSTASTGQSNVYNNVIKHAGMSGDDGQGGGITLGAYTRVRVYNNVIVNTLTYGIVSQGASGTNTEIFNNTIDSSGYLNHFKTLFWNNDSGQMFRPSTRQIFPWAVGYGMYNIFMTTRDSNAENETTGFTIYNNQLGLKNKPENIGFNGTLFRTTGNSICGNVNTLGGGVTATFEGATVFWSGCIRKIKTRIRIRR